MTKRGLLCIHNTPKNFALLRSLIQLKRHCMNFSNSNAQVLSKIGKKSSKKMHTLMKTCPNKSLFVLGACFSESVFALTKNGTPNPVLHISWSTLHFCTLKHAFFMSSSLLASKAQHSPHCTLSPFWSISRSLTSFALGRMDFV